MSIFKNLVIIIASHFNQITGLDRKILLKWMINSINVGEVLPEKIFISLSYTIELDEEKYLFYLQKDIKIPIEIFYYKNQGISQCRHIYNTLIKINYKYVILCDDDDLISPKLLLKHKEIIEKNNYPDSIAISVYCGISSYSRNNECTFSNVLQNYGTVDFGGKLVDKKTLLNILEILKKENEIDYNECDVLITFYLSSKEENIINKYNFSKVNNRFLIEDEVLYYRRCRPYNIRTDFSNIMDLDLS